MSRVFGIIYKYLHSQVFAPSLKAKIRVYMAKDIRNHHTTYNDVIQQILGSRWPDNIQWVKVENLILKKISKVVGIVIMVFIIVYILI